MPTHLPLEILIATRNPEKIIEIQDALRSVPLRLRYLNEFPHVSSVAEVGETYNENAILKAQAYSKQTGLDALADDSGLEVDALDGAPGVFSARFAGEGGSNRQRIDNLLAALAQCENHERRARFVCCMALSGRRMRSESEPAVLHLTRAICEGVVTHEARGTNGFGFDPVFEPRGYSETFAELPAEVKSKISHRALALAAMREFLDVWRGQLDRR